MPRYADLRSSRAAVWLVYRVWRGGFRRRTEDREMLCPAVRA